MDDEQDAADAISALDRTAFGRRGLKLHVEWSKQENSTRPSGNTRPSNTLFVVNFDTVNTKKGDLERHFGSYGKIVDIRMRNDFAFIQFESQQEAVDALEATNASKLMDCVIKVEYAACDAQGRRNDYSPDRRSRERSPVRISSSGSLHTSRSNLKPTTTLFVGNLDPVNTRTRDIESHFEPYGKVVSVRMKKSYAFVKFAHQEDATKALKATNSSMLTDCLIKVEYAASYDQESRTDYSPDRRGRDRSPPRSYSSGQSQHASRSHSSNRRPTKTLFVANIDPVNTRMRDLEIHFEPYGEILDVRIKKNFGFVKFAHQDDATKAMKARDLSMLKNRIITVEYVVSDVGEPRNGRSPDHRTGDRSRSRDYGRSASSSRPSANLLPSKTLYVANFDTANTRKLDLERHFEQYGNILDIRMRTKYAFIEFQYQADATKAFESTHMSTLLDHVISVEYAACKDDRRNGHSSDRRSRDGSLDSEGRRGRGVKRGSPDYSREHSPYRKTQRKGSLSPERAVTPLDESDSPKEDNEV